MCRGCWSKRRRKGVRRQLGREEEVYAVLNFTRSYCISQRYDFGHRERPSTRDWVGAWKGVDRCISKSN